MNAPLSEAELGRRLDYLLGPVLSSRRTAAPLARALAALERPLQDFTLHWIGVIDRSNYEMAYQFAAAAPVALQQLGLDAAETWIIEAMDAYDREGLHSGSLVFRQVEAFRRQVVDTRAATFAEYAGVLELFVCGLAGRRLRLDTADEPKTDTETLFLPPRIALFPDAADNFAVYKILAALLWAQNRYGSWQADLCAACNEYADPARAATLLTYLEGLRLEARVAAVLPGLARTMTRLRGAAPDPRCARLAAAEATVQDSLLLLGELYDAPQPQAPPWRFSLHDRARAVRKARLERERSELAAALADLMRQHPIPESGSAAAGGRFSIEIRDAASSDGGFASELRLDGTPVTPPETVARLLDAILQDLGEIPDDWLQAAGNSHDRSSAEAKVESGESTVTSDAAGHPAGALLYDEWDHQRRHYRRNWCVLRESELEPADGRFVDATLARYRPQVAQLKRMFEMLRGEDRLLKRQAGGDDIDFDAVVEGWTDLRCGLELPERLLTRRHRAERDLAVLFMVDMSGSTKGWVNDAEREALVMLCEALEMLGDRYAIYGFSGITRKCCRIYRIKRFDEPYDAAVRGRIAGITPRDYTRMGVAIRHLTMLLSAVDARTRLLVTLSDGKPDDYSDHYRGEYGIEDTRRALLEAQRAGIRPFCITIDHEARDYLPRLYGPANWTLVDNVERLPLKVADIYRRLTT
jgi:nitric oxide reductase NorD protein